MRELPRPDANYMVVHARHDHSFRVPRPDLTLKIGSPNACNGCHADQTPQWAAQAAANGGRAHQPTPHYGLAPDAARRGKPNVQDLLLNVINDTALPAIVRATAIESLPNPTEALALAAIGRTAADPDPQVRAAAARSLRLAGAEPLPQHKQMLPPLLTDPVRQVRMDAARTLAGFGDIAV